MDKLQFTGDWKILIPFGYKFEKVYAKSYIAYHKGVKDFEVWIWKKGRIIELSGSSAEESALIYKHLLENNFILADEQNRLAYNKELNAIESYDYKKHELIGIYGLEFTNENCLEYNQKYQVKKITDDVIQLLKELRDNGLMEII